MSINSERIDISGMGFSKNALLDTGNSAIILCSPVYSRVVKILEKLECYEDEQMLMNCPCEPEDFVQYPTITFYARGLKMDITPDFYLVNPRNIDVSRNNNANYLSKLLYRERRRNIASLY